jgi:hypothetical protein
MVQLENETNEQVTLNTYLSAIVQRSLDELINATCIFLDKDDQRTLHASVEGRIASHYYISYKTIHMFAQRLTATTTLGEIIDLIASAHEYAEMPVNLKLKHSEKIWVY